MQITEKVRDKIINHLPKGYAATVAKITGTSEATVYRVLHHEQENEAVAEALIQLAHDTKMAAKQKALKHKRLIKQL